MISLRVTNESDGDVATRYSVDPQDHTLTILRTSAGSPRAQKMVFHKLPQGALLEPGKTVEQAFGSGAMRVPAAPAKEPKQRFESPRMAALKKEVDAGSHGAVDRFWLAIENEGAPIVEQSTVLASDNLVTFLWRGTEATRNILVLWYPYSMAKTADYSMVRLGNTDIWFRTVSIRHGARFVYQLSPNDPMTTDEESAQRAVTAQADPLNPHKWMNGPFSTKFEYLSALEMPDAPNLTLPSAMACRRAKSKRAASRARF